MPTESASTTCMTTASASVSSSGQTKRQETGQKTFPAIYKPSECDECVVIDFSECDDKIRAAAQAAVRKKLSPKLAIVNYGLGFVRQDLCNVT